MVKVERRTYANWYRTSLSNYEIIHGMIESYGGRVKDCTFLESANQIIMFYELGKEQRQEFETELETIK